MTTDLQARLLSIERLNKYLTSGRAGDEVVAGAIERLNVQSGARHRMTLAAIHEVTEAIDRLTTAIQSTAANTGRNQ